MSCLLEVIASLGNISEVLNWLQLKRDLNDDEDWSTDWGEWKLDTESSSSQENSDKDICWLKHCILSASPFGNLVSLAYKDRIVLFSDVVRFNENREQPQFSITWKSSIGHTERDKIKSTLCLPIVSQKQTSSGTPDWTCIIVGFTSGYISFYTENGLLLFSQIFEESPVMSISCRTFTCRTLGFGYSVDFSEELILLYHSCVVSIDGFSLLQVLKSCRNQAAKAAASGEEFTNVPSLGYKKWSLEEQEQVNDCLSAGALPPILYDSLVHLSATKGFHNTASSGLPQASCLLSTGRQPFAGVLIAKDVGVQPFVSDIALHYASKLKSALFSAATSWLSRDHGNKDNSKNKPKVKIEAAHPIPFRHTLTDRKRVGLSIGLCSGRRFAAITDDFGRISLLDVHSGTVIRMWKGYRDAECGWIDVSGEWGEKNRVVPFLIIYAPRRGILEVWLPQQGPRVAAFNVSKDARLIYMPHTLLGSNTIKDIPCRIIPVMMLCPNGSLQTLNIPFHLALSGKTSRQARDLHLLKTLKSFLKEESEERILELLKEISTPRFKLQALNVLKSFKYMTPSLAQGMLKILQPQTQATKEQDQSTLDHETRLLMQNLNGVTKLLNFFLAVSSIHDLPAPRQTLDKEFYSKLSRCLMLSVEETISLFLPTYIDYFEPQTKVVKFDFENGFSLASCINCWKMQNEASPDQTSDIHLILVKDIKEEIYRQLELFLFGWQYSIENVDAFSQALFSSGIDAKDLLPVLISYWVQMDAYTCQSALHFYTLVLITYIFAQKFTKEENARQNFWTSMRRDLSMWQDPECSYLAAVICRGVEGAVFVFDSTSNISLNDSDPLEACQKLLCHLDLAKESISLNEWEGLSFEMVEWNLIQKKFELLVPVQRLHKVFSLKFKSQEIHRDLSLKSFIDKGKGYLSELLSKWIIQSGCDLKLISNFLQKQSETNKRMEEDLQDSTSMEHPELENIRYTKNDDLNKDSSWEDLLEVALDDVSVHFHHSLSFDVVFVNLAWEFAALWNRNPMELHYLESSIKTIDMISSPFYKHGLSMMLWETWLADRTQILVRFIEKFGHLPKDRLSLKETGISEFSLKIFFELCCQLLVHILESNIHCEVQHPPNKVCDVFWKEHDKKTPLADLSVVQKMSCYDLVYLHYQLLACLHFIAKFSLKNYKPLQLFPERERLVFFKPFSTTWNFGSADSREAVAGKQHNFLCSVIECVVIALPDISITEQRVFAMPKEAKEAIELGRNWGVSLDSVRRQYICNLYNSGLDAMADQAIPIVRDALVLGSQMVVIAGQRLQYMVSQSPLGAARILALTSPYITDWIKTLNSKALRCPCVPVQHTITMVKRALSFLPDSSPEFSTGKYLLRSLEAIEESQQKN